MASKLSEGLFAQKESFSQRIFRETEEFSDAALDREEKESPRFFGPEGPVQRFTRGLEAPIITEPIKTLKRALETVRTGKTTERERLRGVFKPVVGEVAGEVGARTLSAIRTMLGVPFEAVAPRGVTKGVGKALEFVGEKAEAGARGIGLSEEAARAVGEITPDIAAIGLPLGVRAVRARGRAAKARPEIVKPEPRVAAERPISADARVSQIREQLKAAEEAPITTEPGKPGVSVEEGARAAQENLFRVDRTGKIEPLPGGSVDFPLKQGEALVARNKTTGEIRVQDTKGLSFQEAQRLGQKSPVAAKPRPEPVPKGEASKPPVSIRGADPETTIKTGAKSEIIEPSVSATERALKERITTSEEALTKGVTDLEGLNKAARIVIPKAKDIRETGTIPREQRPELRAAGEKPETFQFKFSEAEITKSQQNIVEIARNLQETIDAVKNTADPLSADLARAMEKKLKTAQQAARNEANIKAKEFRRLRFAAGRSVGRFNKGIPRDVIETLKEIGVDITNLRKGVKDRMPLYTSILDKMKRIRELVPTERAQLKTDLIDAFRLNLFSLGSFSLDMVGNATELTGQLAGGLVRDIVRVVKGKADFSSTQAVFRALKMEKKLPQTIAGELGFTVSGEAIRRPRILGTGKPGLFTERGGKFSATVDAVASTPLYLKGLFDQGAKKFSASMNLWRDAIEASNAAKLTGLDRRAFIDDFYRKPPEASVRNAITEANKAGFNRTLNAFERSVAGSKLFQLVGEAFARWPFQFTRWATEMIGGNPKLFKDVLAGKASAEAVAQWVGKTATGIGGLMLIENMLYQNIDFNTMEYKHANGERTRLSNRDPIPSALFFLAVLKGDVEKATGALRFASLPFARFILGEGGLLGSTMKQAKLAIENADLDPKGLEREFTSTINRAIPGQAILATIKTIFDPTLREGIGANIPGISRLLEAKISPATGEPLAPRQRFPGTNIEIPSIAGTPIPGTRRLFDDVTKLFSAFDLLVTRGKRLPIAGFPPGEIPDVNLREFTIELGKQRTKIMGTFAKNMIARLEKNPDLLKDETFVDQIRKQIRKFDTIAARVAKSIVDRRAGAVSKVKRRRTLRQRRGS